MNTKFQKGDIAYFLATPLDCTSYVEKNDGRATITTKHAPNDVYQSMVVRVRILGEGTNQVLIDIMATKPHIWPADQRETYLVESLDPPNAGEIFSIPGSSLHLVN